MTFCNVKSQCPRDNIIRKSASGGANFGNTDFLGGNTGNRDVMT